MPAYALAHLRNPGPHPDVFTYLERIQSTLDPFGGRFLVHGATVEVKEDAWAGTVVIIGFPDIDAARGWYDSPAYQAILPMRTDNIDGAAIIVDGVAPGHDPAELADQMRRAFASS
jgi:uncharacterized protein (DUF1330 family)